MWIVTEVSRVWFAFFEKDLRIQFANVSAQDCSERFSILQAFLFVNFLWCWISGRGLVDLSFSPRQVTCKTLYPELLAKFQYQQTFPVKIRR